MDIRIAKRLRGDRYGFEPDVEVIKSLRGKEYKFIPIMLYDMRKDQATLFIGIAQESGFWDTHAGVYLDLSLPFTQILKLKHIIHIPGVYEKFGAGFVTIKGNTLVFSGESNEHGKYNREILFGNIDEKSILDTFQVDSVIFE